MPDLRHTHVSVDCSRSPAASSFDSILCQAAIFAARRAATAVSMEDFERACERVIGGLPKNNSLMPLGAFTGDRGVFSLGRSRTEFTQVGELCSRPTENTPTGTRGGTFRSTAVWRKHHKQSQAELLYYVFHNQRPETRDLFSWKDI